MDADDYINSKKELQQIILDFIDNDNSEDYFLYFTLKFKLDNIGKDLKEFKALLHLILNISNNYIRRSNLYNKMDQIFLFLLSENSKIFTNFSQMEIFDIFKSNKLLLLLLFEKEIIKPDQEITNIMLNGKYQKEGLSYIEFFYPEIATFLPSNLSNNIKNSDKFNKIDIESFKLKRRIGENDSYICELIRNDNIKEFISFTEGKLKTLTYYSIETSLFETNQYLINKRISLIEYASFFGSLKIFKHLFLNGFQLNQSLWIFTIHGQNPDIIHFLEQNNIEPNDRKFNECLVESIKCHYINMVQYIQNISNDDFSIELNKSIKYFNYSCFPNDIIDNNEAFFDFCKYNYDYLVKLILDESRVNVNEIIKILKTLIFFLIEF